MSDDPLSTPQPDDDSAAGSTQATEQVHHRLARIEALLERQASAVGHRAHHVPAWRRVTEVESRWPATIAVAVMVGLQLALPSRFSLASRVVVIVLELVLLAVLIAFAPAKGPVTGTTRRRITLLLIAVATATNAWSGAVLVKELVTGTTKDTPVQLLLHGGSIWVTNVIVFALWYWMFDGGGPTERATNPERDFDFQFPQMENPQFAPPDWEPSFIDYLYVSFTNAEAFSPTDTMPLSRWAKMAMLVQSLVSLALVALVVARAVNILK